MKLHVSTLTLLSIFFAATAMADSQHLRAVGDSRFIAPVPFPGFPEAVAVHNGRIYVSTPAAFGFTIPSEIFVYDLETGALLKSIQIQNQPPGIRAISCIAFGDDDNLYVLDEGLGVVKINIESGVQSVYAGPFYPVFNSAFNPPAPLLLNDLAFDERGYLYVTDSFQATIWRVPPGGGAPQVWYSSSLIDGPFGPNGVRVHPKQDLLYFDVTFTATGEGKVFTLPLVDDPTDQDLKLFHSYTPGAGPDGFAFGKSGNLYLCLAGYSEISVLSTAGMEVRRFSGPAQSAADPAHPMPWTNPANIAFDDEQRRIIVTNHASLINPTNPALFAIFDVFVDDKGGKLFGNHDE